VLGLADVTKPDAELMGTALLSLFCVRLILPCLRPSVPAGQGGNQGVDVHGRQSTHRRRRRQPAWHQKHHGALWCCFTVFSASSLCSSNLLCAQAEVLPQGKFDLVRRLKSEGHIVAFIG
jgi:hypothetical protein